MTFDEIYSLSKEFSPMPKSANTIELNCYQALCGLVGREMFNQIDSAYALIELKQIRDAYTKDSITYKFYAEGERRYRRAWHILSDIEKNGTDRERRLLRIMDGRER